MFTRTYRNAHLALVSLLTLLAFALAGLAPHQLLAAPPSSGLSLEFNDGFSLSSLSALPGTTKNDQKLALNAGALVVTAGAGSIIAGQAQENAVGVSYDSSGSYTLAVRMLGPLALTAPAQQAGLFIGQDQRNYVRLVVNGDSTSTRSGSIQLNISDNGKLRTLRAPLAAGTLKNAGTSLSLFLTVDHSANRLTALYAVNSANETGAVQALTRNMPRWLRAKGNRSVAVTSGVITSSPSAVDVRYDWLRIYETAVVGQLGGFKDVDKDGVDTPVTPGEQITYTISITNNSANGTFRIVDPLPPDTSYVAGSASATPGNAAFDAATNSVVWEGNLNTGASVSVSFAVTVNPAPLQSATITNLASATRVGSTAPAVTLGTTTLVSGPADLSTSTYTVTPASATSGQQLTYTLTLVNEGAVNATGAEAQLTIPENATYVADSASASSGSLALSTALRQLVWTAAGPLATGAPVTISFKVTPNSGQPSGTPVVSQAAFDSVETLPTLLQAEATYTAPVPVSFSGQKEVDLQEANPGDTLTYSFSVSNGAAPAELELLDPLPADVSFSSLSPATLGTATYDPATRRVRWAGALGANETASFTLAVTVNSGALRSARLVNSATLGVAGEAPALLLSASTNLLGVPSAAGSSYIALSSTVAGGELATFSLNVFNSGTAGSSGATAQITIPAGLSYVAGSARASRGTVTYNAAAGRLEWSSGGGLAAGGVAQVVFQARASNTLQAGQLLTSVATVQIAGAAALPLSASVIAQGGIGASGTVLYLPLLRR